MKSTHLLGLLFLSAFLISVLPANASVSASQLGAQQIVNTISMPNYVGVEYSDHWSTLFGLFSGWNPIPQVWFGINLSAGIYSYVPASLGQDAISFWVGLSSYSVENSKVSYYLIQAGYTLI